MCYDEHNTLPILTMENLAKKEGFTTLMECVCALAVFSVLASLAIPRYHVHMEKARSGEGLQILEALYKAQRTHYAETRTYTNNLANLEIDLRVSSAYVAPILAATDPIISLPRVDNSYTLTMTAAGVIDCIPTGGICGNLGF